MDVTGDPDARSDPIDRVVLDPINGVTTSKETQSDQNST